jgi:hypothetical protein
MYAAYKTGSRPAQFKRFEFVTRAVKYERSLPERVDIEEPCSDDSMELGSALAAISAGAPLFQFIRLFVRCARNRAIEPTLFRDATFLNTISTSLTSSSESSLYDTLQLICTLWCHIPLPIDFSDPLISYDLVERVFDCLHFANMTVSRTALNCLANFAALSPTFCTYLLEKDIILFLTRYLQRAAEYKEINPGIRLLQTLVSDGVDEPLFYQLKQFIPVAQLRLLRSPWPHIRKHTLVVLIPFLENDSGFEYARQLELHTNLAECALNLIDCTYGYILFRAIALFVRRGYWAAFTGKFMLVSVSSFLAVPRTSDISSVFYVMAGMTPRFWREFWKEGWFWRAIEYADTGSFENRVASTFFVNQMMLFSGDQFRDQMGNQGGFKAVCLSLGCFSEQELEFVACTVLVMLELNERLYARIFAENVPLDSLVAVMDAIENRSALVEKLEKIRTWILAGA